MNRASKLSLMILLVIGLIVSFQNCIKSPNENQNTVDSKIIGSNSENNGGGYNGIRVEGATSLKPGESTLFSVTGGTPPYHFDVKVGDGVFVVQDQNHVLYQTNLTSTETLHVLSFSDSMQSTVDRTLLIEDIGSSTSAYDSAFGYKSVVVGDFSIITNPSDNHNGTHSGAAYVYSRVNNGWLLEQTLQVQKSNLARFGSSVSYDGNRIVIGAPEWEPESTMRLGGKTRRIGAVFIYEKIDNKFVNTALIEPEQLVDNTYFGRSVITSGNLIFVTTGLNRVEVYENVENAWQLKQLLTPTDTVSRYGYRIQYDSGVLAVGTYGDMNFAHVYVYSRKPDGSFSLIQNIPQFSQATYTKFSEGLKVLNGKIWISEGTHVLYEYSVTDDLVTFVKKYDLGSGITNQFHIMGFDTDGHFLTLGIDETVNGFATAGAGYVFEKKGDLWTLIHRFVADQPKAGGYFGCSVDLAIDKVIFGSPGNFEAKVIYLPK